MYEWKTDKPTAEQCDAAQRELVAAIVAAVLGVAEPEPGDNHDDA